MTKKIDKELILNRIKSHYNFKTDIKFAEFLGLKPTTLANWNKRGSIDFDRIFTKCEDLNPNWILFGTGSPHQNYLNLNEKQHSQVQEKEGTYGQMELQEEIDRLNQIISAQDQTIAAQAKTISVMEVLLSNKKN